MWGDKQDCRWLKLLECTNNDKDALLLVKGMLRPDPDRRPSFHFHAHNRFLEAAPTGSLAEPTTGPPTGPPIETPAAHGQAEALLPAVHHGRDLAHMQPVDSLPGMLWIPDEPPVCATLTGQSCGISRAPSCHHMPETQCLSTHLMLSGSALPSIA